MSGRLAVVGLGPGDPRYLTPDAEAALGDAEALYGYGRYLDRVPARSGQARYPSDNLKPWDLVERRLDAAASAGFVIALYNPVSRARPWQFGNAMERLRRHLPETTPVVFGRAVGRPDELVSVATLAVADATPADMATLVIVGTRETRVIVRPGRSPLVYTPRAAVEVSA